jgi:O-antigen/teichoic acid export membrane protein
MAEAQHETQKKAVKAAKWAYVARYFPTATNLLAQIFLARLLMPSDYGIVGVCASVIAFTVIFQGGRGVGLAIIQAKEDSEADYSNALTMNLLLGAFIYVLLIIFSPIICLYAKDPRIAPVLAIQGLSIIFTSYSSILIARLQRNFGFRQIAFRMIPQSLVPLAVGVPLAYAGMNYWSLVISSLVGDALSVLLLTIMVGWIPRVSWDLERFVRLFRFSKWLILEDIIAWAINNVDTFLIARFLSMTDVGVYVFAKRIVTIGVGGIISPLSPIMYSAFCRLADNPVHLRSALLNVNKIVSIVSLPIIACIAVLAPAFVPAIFGAKWTGAGVIVTLHALSEISYLATPGLQLYGALGKPWLNAIVMLSGGVSTIIGFFIAIPYGLFWFVIARLIGLVFVLTPISLIITISLLKVSILQFMVIIRSSAVSATFISLVLVMALRFYFSLSLTPFFANALLFLFAIGSIGIYVLALRIIDPHGFRSLLSMGKNVVGI